MRGSIRSPRNYRSRSSFSSVMTLAVWRWRQTGLLLSIIAAGMVMAIIISCAIPIFTDVMTTAGLRNTLRAAPDSAEMMAQADTLGMSSSVLAGARGQFDDLVKPSLGSLLQNPVVNLISSDFSFATPSKEHRSLTVKAADLMQASPHLSHVQGHIASATNPQPTTVEVMMTPATAQRLHVAIGSTFPLRLDYYAKVKPTSPFNTVEVPQKSVVVTARLAGTFTVDTANAAYWHGEDFQPVTIPSQKVTLYDYSILLSEQSFLSLFDYLKTQEKSSDAVFSTVGSFSLIWYYHLNPSLIDIGKLDALIKQLTLVQNQFQANFSDTLSLESLSNTTPYVTRMDLSSTLFSGDDPSSLERFRSRMAVAQIPVAMLALMIIVLILFFVSLMTNLLVDRQSDAIALLRSRGASSNQVFWALMSQCLGLGLLSLLLGIPLSLLILSALSKRVLPRDAQDALNILNRDSYAVVQKGVWYAVAIIVVVWLTMAISLFLVARSDVLALRRQSGRATQRPLWQRLNLDVIAGILALGGYGVSFYLTSIGNVIQGDAQALIVTPLSIIAPFFLIIGFMFLFLRLFPLLLRLAASLVTRGRGAVSMLALAQMGRSPRQSVRMMLLLALATAFALFTLVYTATQTQHIQDISIYQVGADISGDYSQPPNKLSATAVVNHYNVVPGVLSSSAGYVTQGLGGRGGIKMELRAVDAATFGSAVIWPSQAESKNGTSLLTRLVTERDRSVSLGVTPAIIDTFTAKQLLLNVGSPLTIRIDGLNVQNLQCYVVGIVPHVPTVNDRIGVGGKGGLIPGGAIVDYTTYEKIYAQQLQKLHKPFIYSDIPSINHVWLHTSGDAASLVSLRTSLKKPAYFLPNVQDRWQILAALHTDPLYLILSGLLLIGTITALLLALVGDLLASWLSARVRITNFAILRAIGTTPAEVIRILTWEQAIVYTTGLSLGIVFGGVLSATVIPALSFTDLNSTLARNDQFYALQSAFPTHIVIPVTLLWGLIVMIVIYGIALTMMVQIVSRTSMGQSLRLNED